MSATPRGRFVVSALLLSFSLLGLAAAGHQRDLDRFGVVSGLPDPALDARAGPLLGANVALEQYADPAPALAHLADFYWLRQSFPWDRIEPARGQFEWAAWDQVVAVGTRDGHALIAVLGNSPDWARNAALSPTAPPASPEAFASFVAAFARRYGDQIDVYQVWDEPNIELGWGGQPPSATAYAGLLQAAYAAIHGADPTATVLAAALAPNVETGPDNYSELLYLQQLYDLGAAPYFDGAAGKPYGFYTGPRDRLTDPGVLNFSRFALLRQVMERNGDGHKLLWASNFGWNTQVSPWGQATPQQQVDHTLAAIDRAAAEWPWAGALVLENYQPAAPPGDPHWGFALAGPDGQPTPLLTALAAHTDAAAPAGNYTALHPAARYVGDWEFSELGADIPEDYAGASVTVTFQGSDLALRVRRGNYRGYLYVEVDGQPANRLPRDARGAYLVLTSPSLAPEVGLVPVAAGLAPDHVHTAVIRPDRGWDQWAFAGFSVGRAWPSRAYAGWAAALGLLALLGLAGMAIFGRQLDWTHQRARLRHAWDRLGATGQLVVTAVVSALLYFTSWLTWGNELVAVTRRFGDAVPIAVTALTAGLFYFSPSLLLALAALALLFVLFYLRLDLALAFCALFFPFYLQYRLLWQRGFSMVEVCVLLTLGAWLLQRLRPTLAALLPRANGHARSNLWSSFTLADWSVLAYFVVATLSTALASERLVAIREYRLVILEPVVFYLVLRGTRLDRPALWRVVDFFILGAVAVALIGLFEYVTRVDVITAEGGLLRIRSVYGSPNNLALYLGRALPLAVSVAIVGRHRARRLAYFVAALVLAAATVLTYSRGALLLGVPAGLAVVLLGWRGRKAMWLLGGALAAGLAALPLAARLPRFAGLLDLSSGTSFFRTRLWVSAWRMFVDNPLLGVGPDNFLYVYRSRYILPEAWEEPDLSHPHNLALDFLTRVGVLGFITGVLMQIAFWRQALRNHVRLVANPAGRDLLALNLGLLGLMADMLAHGLVDHAFFLVDLAYVFFLALGLVHHLALLSPSLVTAVVNAPQGALAAPQAP
jgi:hypothetical protein